MVLARPDQYIAWRGTELPGDPDALLDRVTGWGTERHRVVASAEAAWHSGAGGTRSVRSAWLSGTRDISIREVPEPVLIDPTDVIVDISYAGICGSDLWVYRSIVPHEPGSTGHEFIGRVSEVGSGVVDLALGDSVIAPFIYSDGAWTECRHGLQPHCAQAGLWGRDGPGAQAERIRVPFADATLVRLPWSVRRPPARL